MSDGLTVVLFLVGLLALCGLACCWLWYVDREARRYGWGFSTKVTLFVFWPFSWAYIVLHRHWSGHGAVRR